MTETVLQVKNLQVQFQTDERLIQAVDGISFELKQGQTLGIVGESGSGKSVTSLAVMGLVPQPGRVNAGEIWFRGVARDGQDQKSVDLLRLNAEQLQQYRGGQMAMIFQEPMSSLNPVYTIGFQLCEAIRMHQAVTPAQARRLALLLLQEVKLLPSDEELKRRYLERQQPVHQSGVDDERVPEVNEREMMLEINASKLDILERYPHELSGGQIQRVMIAMAISCNPTLLIADEPTTALDVTVQATILDLMRELRDSRQMAMIFITHDLGVIAEVADWVAVMYQGKIVEYGPVLQIFSNPQHPYTKGLLACRPRLNRRLRYLPTVADFMEAVTTQTGQVELREKQRRSLEVPLSEMQVSPTPQDLVENSEVSAAELEQRLSQLQQESPLVSVRDLQVGFPIQGMFGQTKRYFMAVNGVSFNVYPGETLGLVGESGCGKSTLARTLLRLIDPMSGQILFEGQDITRLQGNALRRLRREMQIVFQDPFSSLNPRINIGEAISEPLIIHAPNQTRKQRRQRVMELLERVGLNPEWINRYPHEFSGGQRQRICIARSLALNPKFIICDESVSALDVSVQAQVLNLLKALQGEFRLTYIFISHDLSVVKFMSDRIIVMNQGKIEEAGPSEQLYREPQREYTRQLIASIPTGTLERIQQQQAARSVS